MRPGAPLAVLVDWRWKRPVNSECAIWQIRGSFLLEQAQSFSYIFLLLVAKVNVDRHLNIERRF